MAISVAKMVGLGNGRGFVGGRMDAGAEDRWGVSRETKAAYLKQKRHRSLSEVAMPLGTWDQFNCGCSRIFCFEEPASTKIHAQK